MEISFDPAKREKTLRERGLDFADAARLFDRRTITVIDDRFDDGEERFVSYGRIDDVGIALVWTERDGTRRIISMRRMHEWEIVYVGLE